MKWRLRCASGKDSNAFEGRKRVRCEKAPQAVVGEILAHVGRRRQQQYVRRRPADAPPFVVHREPGQRFGESVALGLADAGIRIAVGGQLVGLVEHHEVVGARGTRGHRLAHPGNHALAREGIDAHDEAVALRPDEWVSRAGVGAARDTERETEQRAHLAFPVADEPGRRHHEDARDEAAREHLAKVEAGHDGLAGTRVVGKQKPQRRLADHVLVDGDALMRQGVDRGYLRGESRVEKMPAGKAGSLCDSGDRLGIRGEVERLRPKGGHGGLACEVDARTPASRSTRRRHARRVGVDWPFSQRLTVANDTPTRFAIRACVNPSRSRKSLTRKE